MSTRFERFNEITFEAYCKTCIDHAISAERKRKQLRAQREQPLSDLTDKELYAVTQPDITNEIIDGRHVVYFAGTELIVRDEILGRAISSLVPRDREIIMRYYFLGERGSQISRAMEIPVSTVHRRRTRALRKLMEMLNGTNEANTVRRNCSSNTV